MKISRAATYAILAASQLSDDTELAPIPCSQLAQVGDMPERFLLQVLRNLVNEQVLVSTRGVDGGYRLARPANQITMLQIVEAIDGPLDIDVLEPIDGLSKASNDLLLGQLAKSTTYLKNALAATKLSSMKVDAQQLAIA